MTLHQGDCVHLATDVALTVALSAASLQGESADSCAGGGRSDASQSSPGDHDGGEGPLYQVIAVDPPRDRCWVRRWPLARHGSPVFEISLQHVAVPHRPHSQSCTLRS
jgi:hypothetical protein